MIDKIKLSIQIKLNTSKFSNKFRYEKEKVESKIDISTGEIKDGYTIEHYIYTHNGVTIKYIVASKKLCVQGRLVNILRERNLVSNLSDYILDKTKNELIAISSARHFNDLRYNYIDTYSYIIAKVNEKIYELTGSNLDIRTFNATEVEVSFNLFGTLNTSKYIELFNLICNEKNRKHHVNYVLENNLSIGTSCYIKTKSNYEKNVKDSYVVNIYDKKDELIDRKGKDDKESNILDESIDLATNILRLEVQLYYKELKKISKRFDYYLDINNCIDIIIKKYQYFISRNENLNFYCYRNAQLIIKKTNKINEREKRLLLNYIKEKYSYNKKNSNQTTCKYNKLLANLGIHPYFIPTKWEIDYLESPISILKRIYNIE